jgi:hypothetical protein
MDRKPADYLAGRRRSVQRGRHIVGRFLAGGTGGATPIRF